MKHITESIIGRKGSVRNIIPIPGIIGFRYEGLSGFAEGWKGSDRCGDWHLIMDSDRLMVLLYSPKAKFYPFLYRDDDWKWNFDTSWNLAVGTNKIKTPGEMYDIMEDEDKWEWIFGNSAIYKVFIEMPDKVEDLIRNYADMPRNALWK